MSAWTYYVAWLGQWFIDPETVAWALPLQLGVLGLWVLGYRIRQRQGWK